MKVIFCEDPLASGQPDSAYETEVQMALALGINYDIISFEALVGMSDPHTATHRIPLHDIPTEAIYRGWMLRPEDYLALYESLLHRGVRLINDPAEYKHCHHLPDSYPIIEGYTPKSVWIEYSPEVSTDQIMALLEPFGNSAVFLKDYVKSQKHYWNEASFIPDASDREAVMRVVEHFLELQGHDLNKGLVFRQFIEFEQLAENSQNRVPLITEYRIFFLHGKPIYSVEYWEEGDYRNSHPPVEQFTQVASRVRSHFFSMDIARRANGEWMIVELGDGQVAGLPERGDVKKFYENLLLATTS